MNAVRGYIYVLSSSANIDYVMVSRLTLPSAGDFFDARRGEGGHYDPQFFIAQLDCEIFGKC